MLRPTVVACSSRGRGRCRATCIGPPPRTCSAERSVWPKSAIGTAFRWPPPPFSSHFATRASLPRSWGSAIRSALRRQSVWRPPIFPTGYGRTWTRHEKCGVSRLTQEHDVPRDARQLRSQRLRQVNFQGDALRLGMNWTAEDLSKPQVLVDSAYGQGHPGTFHFRPLIEEVSNGVFEAGGKPGVFAVSDICDGVAQA